MKLLITCFKWTVWILAKELKIMWYKSYDNFDTWLYVNWDMEDVYKINLNSRIANKVYMEISHNTIANFEQLFNLVNNIDWKKYIPNWYKIIVTSHIFKSKINSEKTTQSIVNKAIIKKLVWDDKYKTSNINKNKINIFVQILENKCSIFVNTTGEWLHNRLYRENTGEAPIKENIAASLIRICNWHFKQPLLDPMCGSGTICIEAAMIAKNIAPWLHRKFAFENFDEYDADKFKNMVDNAKSKIFKWNYKIVGYDADENILKIAKKNATNAGVDDIIHFEQKNISEVQKRDWYIITNPPYGKRMNNYDMEKIYTNLISIYDNWAKWCFITSWNKAKNIAKNKFKIKQLINNWEESQIYLKK